MTLRAVTLSLLLLTPSAASAAETDAARPATPKPTATDKPSASDSAPADSIEEGEETTSAEGDAEATGESSDSNRATEGPESDQMEIDWKRPLTLFDMGQPEEGLKSVRSQIATCGEPSEGRCTAPQIATLHAVSGVILAGSGDHEGGVRAFQRALSYNDVRLLPAYQTQEISRALAEARSANQPKEAAPAPVAPPPPAPTYDTPTFPEAEPPGNGRAIFLLTGLGHAGVVSDGYTSSGLVHLGGAVTIAGRTGDGKFAMGVRGQGGALMANATLGLLGGSALIGGIGGQRRNHRFAYIMGGVGLQRAPAVDVNLFALNFIMGRSYGGGIMGLSVQTAFNAYEYVHTLGVEFGLGALSKGR